MSGKITYKTRIYRDFLFVFSRVGGLIQVGLIFFKLVYYILNRIGQGLFILHLLVNVHAFREPLEGEPQIPSKATAIIPKQSYWSYLKSVLRKNVSKVLQFKMNAIKMIDSNTDFANQVYEISCWKVIKEIILQPHQMKLMPLVALELSRKERVLRRKVKASPVECSRTLGLPVEAGANSVKKEILLYKEVLEALFKSPSQQNNGGVQAYSDGSQSSNVRELTERKGYSTVRQNSQESFKLSPVSRRTEDIAENMAQGNDQLTAANSIQQGIQAFQHLLDELIKANLPEVVTDYMKSEKFAGNGKQASHNKGPQVLTKGQVAPTTSTALLYHPHEELAARTPFNQTKKISQYFP